MWSVVPPHLWAAITVFVWSVYCISVPVGFQAAESNSKSLAASCQAVVQSWAGEMALRIVLGAAEAGFVPGIPYLLSNFYRRKELGLRCGIFLAAAPNANTFSGVLAYATTSWKSTFAPWRMLFLVKKFPGLLMVPVVYYFLLDDPSTAGFLNEEERKVARVRLIGQVGKVERKGELNWRDALTIVVDIKLWIGSVGMKFPPKASKA